MTAPRIANGINRFGGVVFFCWMRAFAVLTLTAHAFAHLRNDAVGDIVPHGYLTPLLISSCNGSPIAG